MQTDPIRSVLVANRGEIAVRVFRTLRRLGIRCVAVYSDADVNSPHVREADLAVRLGPAPAVASYLNVAAVLDAARTTGADAIHPGYGFLSENVAFALAVQRAGITFLGPPAAAIDVMADKISAREAVVQQGVPVVPGIAERGLSNEGLLIGADQIGFPVLVKPAAGGGGKGMHRVDDPEHLLPALETARREARSAFGDDTLFLERFVARPRHIEVQILADRHGNVVHLGERECSLQRRHQKVIEEAPSALLDPDTRYRIGEAACAAARSVGYVGVGTVEFLVSAAAADEFFFLEMNTRLQVEHPVTELVTGLDLVEWQVRVAAGEPLAFAQRDVTMTGHAVEARVYAEDPGNGFLPTGGAVLDLAWPDGTGIRVDAGIAAGTTVGTDYDPMLAKVIAHGPDRASALTRLRQALAQTRVLGVVTNVDFLRFLLDLPEVRDGALDTGLLDRSLEQYRAPNLPAAGWIAAALTCTEQGWLHTRAQRGPWDVPNGWRLGGRADVRTRFTCPGEVGRAVTATVVLRGTPGDGEAELIDTQTEATGHRRSHRFRVSRDGPAWRLENDGIQQRWLVRREADAVWVSGADVHGNGNVWRLDTLPLVDPRGHDVDTVDTTVVSPLPGTIIATPVRGGDTVNAGDPVAVVEAMKMEHVLRAPVRGVVTLVVSTGDSVKAGAVIARVNPEAESGREADDA